MGLRRMIVAMVMASVLVALPACTVRVPLGGADEGGAAESSTESSATTDPLAGIDASARVVALGRPIGQMWVLAGGELVGATDDALDLSPEADGIASVGSIEHPSLEKVLSLEPNLVLLSDKTASHKELHAALNGANVPVLVVEVASFKDYATYMGKLTGATGRDELYEKNVTQVSAKIDEVIERSAQEGRGSYLALRIAAKEGKVLGNDDFACMMLGDLGMTNADGSGSTDASAEAVAATNPDWVFVIYQGDAAKAQKNYEKKFVSDPAWAELAASKAGHVVVLPQDLFQNVPNARWAEAYAQLSQVLHGAWA